MSQSQSQSPSPSQSHWQWENATAGALAGFATVAATHPLDVVRTRFQANDGRVVYLPTYRNTAQALFTIGRSEGLRGLYAGFLPAVLGSSLSWGLYFFLYGVTKRRYIDKAICDSYHVGSSGLNRIKQELECYGRAKERYSAKREGSLSPGLHLASATEAGALVSLCTNPVWLIKTRLQLQNPLHQTRPYSGFYDAFRTIMREEGWRALYKGIVPSLFLVSHAAIQFTSYEELRKVVIELKAKGRKERPESADKMLNSVDYAILGASSKFAAILLSYPFQVIRTRLQQRPSTDGTPRYIDTWHVAKETARYEGLRGFYKGITPNILKNVPAASITFVVYENVMKLLRLGRTQK